MRLRPRTPSARSLLCLRSRLARLALSSAFFSALSLTAGGAALAANCQPATGLSTCIDADNLWQHAGGGSFFSIGGTLTAPAGTSAFGLVASYLSRPIGLRVASPDPEGTVIFAVDNAVNASFLWALGVTDRLELTIALPVTVFQDGAGVADVLGSDEQLPRSAVRDGRLGFAFALVPSPRSGRGEGFALTSRLEFGMPFGATDAFASAGTMVTAPSLAASYRAGRFLAAGELGARVRAERELAGTTVGSQLAAALGASFDILRERRLTVGAEAFGLYTIAAQEPPPDAKSADETSILIPAEWIASVSSAPFLGGDVVFTAGGGGLIPTGSDAALTAPRFRFSLGVRYAPTGRDADADGVLDRDDRCVDRAEDRDGFQDADGCPEPDNDGDGIPDDRDRCRDEAETVDGFQDEDGCPDNDDDGDGVPDASDACRNTPEDRDNFEDKDGCPEPDNDGDGILDAADRCPNGAEDKDGYKDADGCPDPDNDLDQVPDEADRCSDAAEDKDGFQDEDGCPDPDNDEDGLLDGVDKCPMTPETINGEADGDGCPEAGARSLVSFSGDRVLVEKPAPFAAGRADLPKEMEKQVRMMAQLIRGRAPIDSVIVEAYADRPGDASAAAVTLADKRATAVKAVLVAEGVPADRITAATGDLGARRPANAPPIEITARRATLEDKR
jgi:outer membrane protein OmpA-like peptidoglycan-associated protein